MHARLASVAAWGRALTDAEVEDLASGGYGPAATTTDVLLASLNMNDAQGNTIPSAIPGVSDGSIRTSGGGVAYAASYGVLSDPNLPACIPNLPHMASPPTPPPPLPPPPSPPPPAPDSPPLLDCADDTAGWTEGLWYDAVMAQGSPTQLIADCPAWCEATAETDCGVRAAVLTGQHVACGFDSTASVCALFAATTLVAAPVPAQELEA